MSERPGAMGDQRVITAKIHGKYDPEAEAEVITWFKQLLGEDIKPGMREVEKRLRDGVLLIKLCKVIADGTPNKPAPCNKLKLKPNTMQTAFKQMENIEVFLKFCNAMGIPKTLLFPTVDLYEGRNIMNVLS